MAVRIINVKSLLRKFIGPKNQLMSASIAYFVLLRLSAKKHGGQVYKSTALNPSSNKFKLQANFSVNINSCQ